MPSKGGKNIITNLAALLFLVIASFHFVRVLNGWEATFAGFYVPMWVSVTAVILALYLATQMFKMDK